MELPKYTRPEIERRWLVQLDDVEPLPTRTWDIVDRYLDGTRLRLRRIEERGTGSVTFKLGKKFGARTKGGVRFEPIVNVYLDAAEYEILRALEGRVIRKRRHPFEADEVRYGIDVFEDGLVILEAEYPSLDAARHAAPPIPGEEITGHPDFSGAELARRGR